MHNGINRKGRNAAKTELRHEVLTMRYNRRQTQIELVGDFFVYISLHHKRHHFYLARRQRHSIIITNMSYRRQISAVGMGMLFEHQDGAKQLLLRQIGANGVKRTQSRSLING